MTSEQALARCRTRRSTLIAALHNDPHMHQYFLNKVAGPIVNKLFDCRLIP